MSIFWIIVKGPFWTKYLYFVDLEVEQFTAALDEDE